MAKKAKQIPEAQLRVRLAKEVVDPLFGKSWTAPATAGIPPIVLENRWKRAHSRILEALVSRGSVVIPQDILQETRSLVGLWESVLFDDGFRGVEKYEIDRAKEREYALALESGDPVRVRTVIENEYRRKVVEQYGRIELRGLGTSHRILLEMDRVFVPLHLEAIPKEDSTFEDLMRMRMTVETALAEAPRALITGAAGSGKSTLVGWLATQAAARNELPVVLPARILTAPGLTCKTIGGLVGLTDAHVREACLDGRALLLVDGLEEAAPAVAGGLRAALAKLAVEAPKLRMVVTARPAAGLSIAGFTGYSVGDLTGAEVDEFVDKWCLAAEESAPRKGSALEESREAAENLKKRIQRTPAVQRLASNPLMATILCVVHRFLGKSIPEHRVTLYDKCADVFLHEWDRSKFPEGSTVGKLDALAKRHLLTWLAREMHDAGLVEMAEGEVVTSFQAVLPRLGTAGLDAKALLAEIRDRSGLLVEKRPGYFGFSHLTFQEYLTASGYVRDWKRLPVRYSNAWWQEVIYLAAGVPGVDAGKLIQELLREKNELALIMAARCLETATVVPVKVREQVERELKSLIPPRDFTAALDVGRLGAVIAPLLMQSLQHAIPENAIKHTIVALGATRYAPAIPSIAALIGSRLEGVRSLALITLEHFFPDSEMARQAAAKFRVERPASEPAKKRKRTG